MSDSTVGDAAIAVVRRNTEEVQGKGNWRVFEELNADDFVDHTSQPGTTPDRDGVRVLYKRLRAAFPRLPSRDPLAGVRWRPRDHVQDLSRHPTQESSSVFRSTGKNQPLHRRRHAGRRRQITEHWGVATLLDLMQRAGVASLLREVSDDDR